MTISKKAIGIFSIVAIFLFAIAAPVKADWDPGDDYKMHYPQLPDPYGWDVRCTAYPPEVSYSPRLADDWQCTETGPVTDIHIWGSWRSDSVGNITAFHVAIWGNLVAYSQEFNYSIPKTCVWNRTFYSGEYTERSWGEEGDQGWYDPTKYPQLMESGDHEYTYQYNFYIDPAEAFVQQEGNIYWLEVLVDVEGTEEEFGWKTSLDHFEDEAVINIPAEPGWGNLTDPNTGESLDLAFVITGEPRTVAPTLTPIGMLALICVLSAIAAVTIVRKRR